MLDGARKTNAHVIGNAWFARRINDARGKLRHKYARFHADAALESAPPAGLPEFLQPVEHIEVHNAGHGEAVLPGEYGKMGGRISVSVVREKSMAMDVHVRSHSRPLRVGTKIEQSLVALRGI